MLPDLEFMPEGDLNLYVYPEVLDYIKSRPLGDSWHRIESSVRETEEDIELPEGFTSGEKPLIYFSLGSLGSADVPLMKRVLSVLAQQDANIIVSMGPLHDEIELAPNMFGAEFLPQTKLIPQVDLVITHGGNNTVTESMHFGKPMILLPSFWDQYDNAQRVDECWCTSYRLPTYTFTDEQLSETIRRFWTTQKWPNVSRLVANVSVRKTGYVKPRSSWKSSHSPGPHQSSRTNHVERNIYRGREHRIQFGDRFASWSTPPQGEDLKEIRRIEPRRYRTGSHCRQRCTNPVGKIYTWRTRTGAPPVR